MKVFAALPKNVSIVCIISGGGVFNENIQTYNVRLNSCDLVRSLLTTGCNSTQLCVHQQRNLPEK